MEVFVVRGFTHEGKHQIWSIHDTKDCAEQAGNLVNERLGTAWVEPFTVNEWPIPLAVVADQGKVTVA